MCEKVEQLQLSPLPGGEIEVGPLGEAVALLITGKLCAGDPAGHDIGGIGVGQATAGGEVVLQPPGLEAGFGHPVSHQAEGAGVRDAGGAELIVNK